MTEPTPAAIPVFVVGAPRVGARIVTERLSACRNVFTPDPLAPDVVDAIPRFHPRSREWTSGRLTAADIDQAAANDIADVWRRQVRDRDDHRPGGGDFEVVDGSPQHTLRVPFLAALFPQARFVFVHAAADRALAAAINSWQAQRHARYTALPGWDGPPWPFALVPRWGEVPTEPIEQLAATHWRATLDVLLADLDELAPDRWCVAWADPDGVDDATLDRVCGFLGWDRDRHNTARAVTDPTQVETRVRAVVPVVAAVDATAREHFAERPAEISVGADPTEMFAGSYDVTVPRLLSDLESSLLVSTYQSGRLILCRANGTRLNTHFRMLASPMGIAVGDGRFAVGTDRWIITYRDHQSAARQLTDARYDGCFLPLSMHATGDIRVHEMAYAGDELWAVSTRFSCLVTLDDGHSFVPKWRPPFITALAAEDRCHLNGFALRDGEIRYVSALGRTDTAGGWRDNKANGGIVIDIDSGDVVLQGLSMPHSPRWYDGKFWICESGKGTLATADLESGTVETVAELPGFTRGLTFAGNYAFVGLSEVRETVFRGLPIVQRADRTCGVAVIDLTTGTVAGLLEFTGAVQEIFDVQLLPGFRWPELGVLDSELLSRSFVLPRASG